DPYVAIADWTLKTPDGEDHQVHAPKRLDELLLRHPAVYVLEADVRLPENLRARPLTLTWLGTDAFATLVVDGSEAILPLSLTPFDRVRPSRRELVFPIPAPRSARETLHLALRVQHVDSWTATTGLPLRLADAPYGEHQLHVISTINSLLLTAAAAILSLLALAAGISFLLDRRRVTDGWYALMPFGLAAWHWTAVGVLQLVDPRDCARTPLWAGAVVCVCGIQFTRAQLGLRPARVVPLALVAIGMT